jgi:hypothetical protein
VIAITIWIVRYLFNHGLTQIFTDLK